MTDDRKRNTGGEVELLPLPTPPYIDEHNLHGGRLAYSIQQMKDYARANVERALAESRAELEEARGMVIEANNSLYGSQGYFHSLDGGAYDRHHLARGIEDVKARLNVEWRRAERLAALEDARRLDALDRILVEYGRLEITVTDASLTPNIRQAIDAAIDAAQEMGKSP